MKQKNYYTWSGLVFLAITIVHLLRIINGWEANIGGWSMPTWVSWLAVLIAGYLSLTALKFSKRS